MKALLIRLSVVGMIALLALGVAGCGPKSAQGDSLAQSDPALSAVVTATANGQAEGVGVQAEAQARPSAATEPAESQVTQSQNGSSLLQTYCAQCHQVRLLEQTRRPRAGWERILSRMERHGVRLSEAEKSILLDYLTVPEKP